MPFPKVRKYGQSGPRRRILLVAPKQPDNFWSLSGLVELLGAKTLMPNSALATLMALTPEDVSVEYVLCDENISPETLDTPCDLAAITGTTVHAARIRELCRYFKDKGVPVALGGPYASVNSESCQGLADYHFIGEAEYTWPRFLREWSLDDPGPVYHQESPVDLEDSPSPDWSLVDARDYMVMSVQTSRGCPHHCDFCDVIRYLGHKHRIKNVDQVISEVKNAHRAGASTVFFSDDNFIGRKAYAKEILTRILPWNTIQERPLSFSTQLTVNVADDTELLRLMAEARLNTAFIGVETVREESLAEVGKYHNLKKDNRWRLAEISRYGIVPLVGLVVGFDHDDASVFEDIYRFLEDAAIPIASLGVLNAPKGTPLYERLEKEGRLLGEDWYGEWHAYTNIIPKNMTRTELLARHRRLFQKIYDPKGFQQRFRQWLQRVDFFNGSYKNKKNELTNYIRLLHLLSYITFRANPKLRGFFLRNITWSLIHHPKLTRRAITLLGYYRHYYEYAYNSHEEERGNG